VSHPDDFARIVMGPAAGAGLTREVIRQRIEWFLAPAWQLDEDELAGVLDSLEVREVPGRPELPEVDIRPPERLRREWDERYVFDREAGGMWKFTPDEEP
jgi:hypothetical protein